ncbi:MAG: preprotein translocase subunit YajC [Planctomycetota bacterium]|nr:preprotein translocase subunit YajC [Planctomycetota bacterium]
MTPPTITSPLLLSPALFQGPQTPPEGAPVIETPPAGGEEGGGPPNAPSLLDGMFPFLAIGLVLWFLIFAPEKKARKKRQEMLDAIKKGDRVVTTSGLHGEVMAVRADEIDLSAGGSKFTYSRAAVNEIID